MTAPGISKDAFSIIFDRISIVHDRFSRLEDSISIIKDTFSILEDSILIFKNSISIIYDGFSIIFTGLRLEEVTALLVADRQTELLHHGEHVFPHAPFFRERLVPQQVARVIRRHQGDALELLPVAAQLRDAGQAQQPFHRRAAERDDDLRLEYWTRLHRPLMPRARKIALPSKARKFGFRRPLRGST